MKNHCSSYYDFLKSHLNKFQDSNVPEVQFLPDLFILLSDLLNIITIRNDDRIRIGCALGYLVAPIDMIPEEIHGAEGYVDDLFVFCYILNGMKEKYGMEFLTDIWEGKDNLENTLAVCTKISYQLIDKLHLKNRILSYIGLNFK